MKKIMLTRGSRFCKLLTYLGFLFASHLSIAQDQYSWRNITVGAGGFAPNIIYSTAEEGLAYLRTDMGGAYRWDTQLSRWVPLQDSMTESSYFGIESLAADPNDANIVHVAAGMYKHFPAAMLRSFDRGNNWEVTPVPFRMGGNEDGRGMGERLAIDPNNTQILYFGSRHDGLYRSLNQGKTWKKVTSFPHKGLGVPEGYFTTNAGISFIVFDPSSKAALTKTATDSGSRVIFAAIADATEQHLYRSNNGGKTWVAVTGEPKKEFLPAKGVLSGEHLYITYTNNAGPNGITDGAVYKLNIRTNVWTDITPGNNSTPNKKGTQPPGGFMGISVDRQNPGTLAVSTINRWSPCDTIFRSTDGGNTWVELAQRSQRDVSNTPYLYWGNNESDFGWWLAGLAINPFNPEEMVYTTGATVYRTQHISAPKTLHWKPWITGIEQTAVIVLRSLPKGPELLSGFGDISGFTHTNFNKSPHVMFTSPVFANTNNIDYAQLKPNIVVRSGTHPHRGEEGDPTLAYSLDSGITWTPMYTPAMKLEPGKPAKRYDISGHHAIIPSADGNIFMFMAPIPLITHDKGKSWHKVIGLPHNLRPIADRVNPNKFYALNFSSGKMYSSIDNGETFFTPIKAVGLPTNIHEDHPYSPEDAWPLLASPYHEGHLWYVSSQGLFRSTNGGKTFNKVISDVKIEEMDFGKPAPGEEEPSLLAIGVKNNNRSIWRSDNSGRSWTKISTKNAQYGQRFRCISGDLRHFGRVYVGTDGRGIVMGEPANRKSI